MSICNTKQEVNAVLSTVVQTSAEAGWKAALAFMDFRAPAIQILFESLSLRLKAFTLSSKREQAQVFLHYLKLLLLPRSLLLYLIAYSDTKQPSKDIFKDIYGPLEWSKFPRTFPEFLVCNYHNTTFLPQMYPNNLLGMKRGMRRLRALRGTACAPSK